MIWHLRNWIALLLALCLSGSAVPAAPGYAGGPRIGVPGSQAPRRQGMGMPVPVPSSRLFPGAARVEARLLEDLAAQAEVEFLVILREQADLSAAAGLGSKPEKATFVYQRLTAIADRTQPPVRTALDALGVEYRPFWIANMIWVRGDAAVLLAMAARPEVGRVVANTKITLEPAYRAISSGPVDRTTPVIPWNILRINAASLWAQGFTGQGVVIGGQDTGYQWDHPALKSQYRGWNGSSVDHNYNWYDAIGAINANASCPDPRVPCDDDGHGTHTMGTLVGDDGGANAIGAAPGARWIGCRNMVQGVGSSASYSECFQWFLAPTDLNGANADPARAPDVINNSWACPTFEVGCDDPLVLLPVVATTRAAGILVVVSAGNGGPGCQTVTDPAAIYDAAFTVGATDEAENIALFSSRGPVTVDGSQRLKPDISAPGVNVFSSYLNGTYAIFNGTSMAGPHVAGAAALLISADPTLAGQVDRLEDLLRFSSIPRTTPQNCGIVPGSQVPNHTYGYGRVDAQEAYYWLSRQPTYLPRVLIAP